LSPDGQESDCVTVRQSSMRLTIQSCLSPDVQESDCVRVRQSSMRLTIQSCCRLMDRKVIALRLDRVR